MSFTDFVQYYGPAVMYGVITAVFGFLGACVKKIYDRITADQTKKAVAETVVKAVEQMYKNLHGDEKKQKAIEGITQMLENKGITISELEVEILLEAAVAEFNAQRTGTHDNSTENAQI